MNRNSPLDKDSDIYRAILEIKDLDECHRLFEDLCAVTELRSLEQRYEVAKMLMDGKVYTEIMKETNASSATISRVNRMLNYGSGCIGEIIKRVNENKDLDNKQ